MITANHIAEWAKTIGAQSELPRLVRRLIHTIASTTQIAMPAGESVALPGLDGELHSLSGSAWVPAGYSCWEASCRADVAAKATEDFNKRTAQYDEEYRRNRSFIYVTGRRWAGKARWLATTRKLQAWREVRAYDADDLEQWLEQSPAVTLAFGEEIGLVGPGVESLGLHFFKWRSQCVPPITSEALLTDRTDQSERLTAKIQRVLSGEASDPIAVKADSVQEAVAFVSAVLLGQPQLAHVAAVVTDENGWRFVEKNQQLQIAIAALPQVAEAPTVRGKLAVIVPYASGDMIRQFKGVAGRLDDAELHLERPMHSEFEKALQAMGVDENDSRRLSTMCGRSWSVFRRQYATNPAVRRPGWLDSPAAAALATVCLLGTWSSDKEADKDIVVRICGRPFDDLERDLITLAHLDDSPLLHIGSVWKAKSALELMAQFGDRIVDAELDRFFRVVEDILGQPDPQLELPDDQRYAAAIYGKVRPTSGLLLIAICDTLIKLAVRGPDVPALAAKDIQLRVDILVRNLLKDADRIRWLSLSSQLPALAEASPNEFLSAIESSLAKPDGAVRSLFLETSSSGFGGRCWHAGMLWALETLAWAPNRLIRVSLILAKFAEIKIEGNWGNTPQSSLVDLYRSWFPQTAAPIDQRIQALDVLIQKTPTQAFALLNSLTGNGSDFCSHTARPKWRDDDAGAGYGATGLERHQMLMAAADRYLDMAAGNAERVAALISKYTWFDEPRRKRIRAHLDRFDSASDEAKETLRHALRNKIHWHRNYNDKLKPRQLDHLLKPLEQAYERLAPADPIARNGWLFKGGWVDLPIRVRGDDHRERERITGEIALNALHEIFDERGWKGVLELAERYPGSWTIGQYLSKLGIPREELCRWIVEEAGDLERGREATSIAGAIVWAFPAEEREEAIDNILSQASELARTPDWKVRFLVLCPHGPPTWNRAEVLDREALFWSTCTTNLWLDDPKEMEFALRQLVTHKRPVSALNACHIKFEAYDPEIIVEILEGVLKGHEIEGGLPQAYVFQSAIDFLENSGCVDEMRLIQLEFALIKTLGFEGEHHAKSLYHALMSRPEIFVELLRAAYRPRSGEEAATDDGAKVAAQNAWAILHACVRQPGARQDGSIDPDAFNAFVHEARQLSAEQDRLEVCDMTLGGIMAYAPDGADGIWPFELARDALEEIGTEDMLGSFRTGIFNKRGVHSRGVFDGGEQERDLAAHYRRHASALEGSHPKVAGVLHDMARSYDRHGLMEDLEAKLRIEGH